MHARTSLEGKTSFIFGMAISRAHANRKPSNPSPIQGCACATPMARLKTRPYSLSPKCRSWSLVWTTSLSCAAGETACSPTTITAPATHAISMARRSRGISSAVTENPSSISAVGMRWPISTIVREASATAAKASNGPVTRPRRNSANAPGTSTGKNSRMKAGPARGLLNGPVSAPSAKRGRPNRFVPTINCCQHSAPIHTNAATSNHHARRWRGGAASNQEPSARLSRGRRTAASASATPRPFRQEHSTIQAHQRAADRANGVRSQTSSRLIQQWARKAASMATISISAAARACSSASGRTRQANQARRSTRRSHGRR